MDILDVLDGPPGDRVAKCLTLVDLCCCRRACRSLRAWAEEAIELRGGVTRADVDAGMHTRALHWLVRKSTQRRIALAAGTYMLGDMDGPAQVYNVRPPTYDEDDDDEETAWLHRETDWRPGYGPLVLSRPLTLIGTRDVTLSNNMCWAVEVKPLFGRQIYTSVGVRLEGLNFVTRGTACLYVGPCSCEHPQHNCDCTAYAGSILTAHDCSFDSEDWMYFDGRVRVTGDSVMDMKQVNTESRAHVTFGERVKCLDSTCGGGTFPNPNGYDFESDPPGCECYKGE